MIKYTLYNDETKLYLAKDYGKTNELYEAMKFNCRIQIFFFKIKNKLSNFRIRKIIKK